MSTSTNNSRPGRQPHVGAAALALADGRLPTGGYAHSGGLEPAVVHADIVDYADLSAFLRGRVHTTGFVAACFAVAAWHACDKYPRSDERNAALEHIDAELRARTPHPAVRRINSDLGRLLQRSMRHIAPSADIATLPLGLQQPLVYGAIGYALGLDRQTCATIVLHDSVTVPAAASVKVLHVSPFDAHRAALDLARDIDELAARAVDESDSDPSTLPAVSTPLADIALHLHQEHHGRLFAS